jgi:hypothetical protein
LYVRIGVDGSSISGIKEDRRVARLSITQEVALRVITARAPER